MYILFPLRYSIICSFRVKNKSANCTPHEYSKPSKKYSKALKHEILTYTPF